MTDQQKKSENDNKNANFMSNNPLVRGLVAIYQSLQTRLNKRVNASYAPMKSTIEFKRKQETERDASNEGSPSDQNKR